MPKNKLKRYTGAEVVQPKSIAEQLLAGTKIGNFLYGKQKTYKDGYNKELKDSSFNESANGQLVQRMGETAKDAGKLVATGLAFGNPLTASNTIAPLIAGSQAYWIGHGINDGAQRIDNIGEGVKNFVEDPSWQNAGTVVKEVPMLTLDVAGSLPVARTVIETSKNVIPAAQQAAQRIAGSVDDAITNTTKQVVESGVVGVNELPAQLVTRVTSTPKVQEPLPNVGWAPSQTIDIRRAGELTEMYYPNRWDVVEEGANPFGVWLQGKFGTPRTNITNPGKGEKAVRARQIFEDRPQYVGNVSFKKPVQTIGEVPNRSSLSYEVERMGADGIIYNGVYDNGYNNNQVVFSFNRPELGDEILLSMRDLVPQKFVSVSGLKPVGGKMIADKVVNHPHILDRTKRLQQTYKRIIDSDYVPNTNWRKNRDTSPGMKIVDDIDIGAINTNSPTGTVENIGGYYNPSEDVIYVRRSGTPDAQASTAFHEDLHGYDFGRDKINDWIIKHLIDPEKVKGMSPQAQKYYLSSQEAPVHALQHGFIKGLDIGASYPGDTAFDELLDSGIGGSLYYFKTQTPKDKRRLWRAMTGDLFTKRQGGKLNGNR